MAINTLATATLFMTQLDKIAVQEATTGWMDANAGQVIYNGGSEVKIPKMNVQGMGDYDRDNGYQRGSVTLEYETRKMTQDRGRLFQLDPMDINENNFVTTAGAVMGEFQRTRVIPEIDAYRISKIATETIAANKAGMVGYAYVPGATGTSALRKIKEGIKAVRNGYNGPLVCQATPDFIMELELELAGKINATTFSKGGIQTQVPSVDGVPLIATPSDRMYTTIKINDGKTSGQEKGGYEKGSTAKNLNFFICPTTTPIAITKQDIMRIFDPTTNQKLNAWQMDYRRFHDIWILDNKLDSVYLKYSGGEIMRLIRVNVEREADGADAAKLMQDGFNLVETPAQTEETSDSENVPEKAIEDMTVEELKAVAKERGLTGVSSLAKQDLIDILKG